MICPVCEGENRDGAHFCRHCGLNLKEPPVSEVKDAATEGQDAGAQDAVADETEPGAQAGGEGDESPDSEDGGIAAEADAVAGADSEETLTEAEESEPGTEGQEAEAADVLAVAQEAPAGEDKAPEDKQDEQDAPEDEQVATTIEMDIVPQPVVPETEAADSEPQEEVVAEPVEQGDGEVSPPPEWLEEEDSVTGAEPEIDVPGFWREESEPMASLVEGTVIADRYIVSDVLDAQESTILYYVRDLWRCWQCGFEGNAPDEAFCAQCGASLDRKPSLRLLEVGDAAAKAPAGEVVAARLSHEGRTFLLLAEPERKAPVENKSIRFLVGQRSDAGLVRELDEDSILSLTMAPTYGSRTGPVLGLFAVADGMGGHEGGEVASKLALQVLTDRVIRTILLSELSGEFRLDEDVIIRLRQAMMAANDEVYLARQKRGNDMGTTLTAVLVRDSRLYVAHVGDCRAYRWNADGLEQLTVDHSVVASMVASGQAKPEEIYTHPHRSVIYRCVGDQPTVQVDTDVLRLAPGDRLIVCCDGLWEMVRNEGIEDVMLEESEPQAACDLLVKRANLAGGDDNISVIVVQVEAV